MPPYVVKKATNYLKKSKISIKSAKILVLGIAYKKNINDTRESPGVEIIKILRDKGAYVQYHDPYVLKFPKMRKYSYNLQSIQLTKRSIMKYDLIILVTDHSNMNYEIIQKLGKRIVDTRGVYSDGQYDNVVQA